LQGHVRRDIDVFFSCLEPLLDGDGVVLAVLPGGVDDTNNAGDVAIQRASESRKFLARLLDGLELVLE